MDDFILDAELIEAMLFSFALSLTYAEQELAGGELDAEQYEWFEWVVDKLNDASEKFGGIADDAGETVH